MTEPTILLTGVALGESPRWHDDRLWFADWGAQELIAMDASGRAEVIASVPSFPFSIDWLPDGTLLIVSAADNAVLRLADDGTLTTRQDLSSLATTPCSSTGPTSPSASRFWPTVVGSGLPATSPTS